MRTGKKGDSSAGGILFAAMFMGIGGAIMWFIGLQPIMLSHQSYDWNEVACTVAKSHVTSKSTDDGTVYRAVIEVSYAVGNIGYTGGSYSFDRSSSSGRSAKKEIVDAHPVGSQQTCYVNPDVPEQIVINRGIPGIVWIVIPFCMIFVLIGAFVLAATLNWLPEKWSRTRHKPVQTNSVGYSTLEPRHSKKAKVIGTLCFALIWNGIVSVFVYKIADSFINGDPSWFIALFLVPFVLIGLVLIGAVVHAVLASYNPTPVLSVSEGSPTLGQEINLEWGFSGRTQRIEHLSVVLQAAEKATYRVGTDTKTETRVFHTEDLVVTDIVRDTDTGVVTFSLPADSMHSFKSSNNQIEWVIKLHAKIARWADIKDEYPLIVRPLEAAAI